MKHFRGKNIYWKRVKIKGWLGAYKDSHESIKCDKECFKVHKIKDLNRKKYTSYLFMYITETYIRSKNVLVYWCVH